ncbi:MAG TPA: hypothetical protein VMZ30_04835 [Pyrinomonadaceae bacterium]|nr:hypothetical protein [Pyrinomonadaceae bacterium]
MDIKEGAIYQLPNGRELVADATMEQAVLYNFSASEPGQYQLNSEGRLMFNGQLTAWAKDDLLETGRFAPPDVTEVLGDNAKIERETALEQNV